MGLNIFNNNNNDNNMYNNGMNQNYNFDNTFNNGMNQNFNFNNNINNNQNNREIIKNNLINNFIPLTYITFDKNYLITLTGLSLLLNIISRSNNNSETNYSLLTFIILLIYNITYMLNLKRQYKKLTSTGCLLGTASVFFSQLIFFGFISGNNIAVTVIQTMWFSVKCFITQFIGSVIIRIQERNQIKQIENMEKQISKYERKINKIWKK